MKVFVLTAAVMLGVAQTSAQAFPIALPLTEGRSVIVAQDGEVIATYQGNSATYSNDLYLLRDALGLPGDDGIAGNDQFIFNNQSSPVGSTANLGTFTAGTELMFRLYVNNTGYAYFTGPGSRNPDAMIHARVEDEWQAGETLVSFEDLYGTPEGIDGFNDLSFSFTNTSSDDPVPEPTTLALLGAGLFMASRRRFRG